LRQACVPFSGRDIFSELELEKIDVLQYWIAVMVIDIFLLHAL
jgi:hypothetical protein